MKREYVHWKWQDNVAVVTIDRPPVNALNITLLNENYPHPPMPKGVEAGICRGMYPLKKAPGGKAKSSRPRVQLLGSGSILPCTIP